MTVVWPRKSYYEAVIWHAFYTAALPVHTARSNIDFWVGSGAEWYVILGDVFLYKSTSFQHVVFLQKQRNWSVFEVDFWYRGGDHEF